MADDRRNFDELMARMGVRKLDPTAKPPAKRPPEKSVPAKKPAPPPAPVKAAPARDPRDAMILRLQEDKATLEKALADAEARMWTIEAALADARQTVASDPSSLGVLLDARGVRGADESRYLLDALSAARLTDAFVAELTVRRPEKVARFLHDKVLLSCARPGCPTFVGPAILTVPAERCDACGGKDVERARRRFQDACLVNGILVVGVIGGTVRDQRLLEQASTHHRLALRFFGSLADARAAGAQLVIGWNVPIESGPRVIATKARNAVDLMDEVAGSLLP